MKFILRDFQITIILFFAINGTTLAQLIQATEWKTLEGHKGPVLSVAFSPDGNTLASGSTDKLIKLWSVKMGIEIKTMQGHKNWVRSVSFGLTRNILVSGSNDKTIKLWSTTSGIEIKTIQGHKYFDGSVSFSSDGTLFATGSGDKTIKLWSTVSGNEIVTLKGHSGSVRSISFEPNGAHVASGSNDGTIKLWSININAGFEMREYKGHVGAINSVVFNPDGTTLASGSSDGTIKLWSIRTGMEIKTFRGHSDWVLSVTFSPDGNFVASGSRDGTIKLWSVSTGKLLRTLRYGENISVLKISFSPNGILLASGGSDATMKLWSFETGKEIKTLELRTDRVYSISFNPDGTLLAVGGFDGKIKILKIDYPQQLPILVKKKEGKEDLKSPVITILEPTISRGMKKHTSEKKIAVRGKAVDESGIYEVLVNGVEAQLSSDGTFWADVRLRIGENKFEIVAEDTKGNRATKSFTVIRESAAPPPPVVVRSEEFSFGEYHALVIAVQSYTYKSVTDLDYPIQDAKQVMNTLIENYTFEKSNVHFLENPDRGEILKKFTELRRNLTENDNLLIFYAGHGYWDEDERQGYWLPKNADWNDRSDWLSNSVLRDKIRALKAKHTLLISDACFSGGIFKVREAFVNPEMSIQKIYEMPSRKALTSGALMTVPDKSVFVEYLVKRLINNKEKYLYSEKLYVNMKEAVINNSPTNQTPQFGVIGSAGDEGGDFVFVRK